MVRTLVATLTLALLSGCGSQKPPVTPEGEEKVGMADRLRRNGIPRRPGHPADGARKRPPVPAGLLACGSS